jgi:hypothetical protein
LFIYASLKHGGGEATPDLRAGMATKAGLHRFGSLAVPVMAKYKAPCFPQLCLVLWKI